MEALEKHNGSAEDPQGIFQGFEKYLIKLLKLLGDKQRDEEEGIMNWAWGKADNLKCIVLYCTIILINHLTTNNTSSSSGKKWRISIPW